MQNVKQKVSNAASAAKEHVDIYKAQAEEKAAMASARTKEEKEIAHERRKAKEADAKMHLHEAKAQHAAEKLAAKQSHHLHGYHTPVGGNAHHHVLPARAVADPAAGTTAYLPAGTTAYPTAGATYPTAGAGTTYPPGPGGHLPGHNKYV